MADHWFGSSVALYGDTALIGAPGDDELGGNAGAAFLFDTRTQLQTAKLLANDAYSSDILGTSVALDGALAMVGASGDNNGALDTGAAYLFDAATGQQIAKLVASDAVQSDNLGPSVALGGSGCIAGASSGDGAAVNTGAAYVFSTEHSIAAPYCFGAGGGTPCPCANAGHQGHGCANSAFPAGARLWGDGNAGVTNDHLTLRVENSRPHQPGLFFQGNSASGGGAGLAFGDGLRCAGGGVLRLEVDDANASGRSATTIDIAATGGLSAGDVKRYQWWYRDPGVGPCGTGVGPGGTGVGPGGTGVGPGGTGFNLSNGLEVVWGP